MPAVSEKQERFMNAVAHNPEFAAKVDVPQSVGKEFVAKDEVSSAAGVLFVAPDGDVLLLLRSPNEENFASHWALPGGGADDGETPEQAARREVSEEIGNMPCDGMTPLCERVTPKGMVFTTFICPVAEKFAPTLNDEHSGYAWVPIDKPLAPIHPAVADVLSGPFMEWLNNETAPAMDRMPDVLPDAGQRAIAFDKASVRSYDQDGRMKVERSTISKAIVSPYIGREIVGWKALGLDPNKTYRLLRDPEELKAASDTFNNLPVLSEHVAVSASAPRKDLVIGSTGTDAAFDGGHLTNSLVFWDGSAIQDIEDEKAKELSCAYHYRPDMTPGTYEGEAYDGVMREIKGNHVALVPRGRVGPDAYVADSAPVELVGDAAPLNSGARNSQQEKRTMAHKIPKRDKVAVVKALNAIKPDLAQDADISDIIALVEKLENEGPEDGAPVMEDASDIHEFLKAKLSDEDYAAACELLKPAADEEEEVPAIKPDEEVVSKPAMDAAIAAATAKATNDALSAAKAIREAERAVRPYVGEMSMAHDSADAVYRSAFDILGVKHKDVHPSAFPAILAAQTTASNKKPAPMAMDAKAKENFSSRFPDASRIAIK